MLFTTYFLFQENFGEEEQVPNKAGMNFTEELLSATSLARKLVDQMTLAKSYLVIAKERGNLPFSWQLSAQIRNCQRLISKTAVSRKPVSFEEAQPVMTALSQLIYKAQDQHYDIATTIVTLKKHIDALEERLIAATVLSAEFGQLAAEATPKNQQCLNIKLTVDWDSNPMVQKKIDKEIKYSPRLMDNNLYHFCIFSDNVLATSVVVNSTVSNAEHPQQLVFHVVTNGVTYRAMSRWFSMSNFRGSTIEVRNSEEFSWLNASYSPFVKEVEEFKERIMRSPYEEESRNVKFADLLKHLRFYIPEILPSLERVIFLDDDVVVQKDLTPLFSLDLHGNVNGAVETCLETYHRYHKYLNFSNSLITGKFDPQACMWAFGMNVFDLVTWKKLNATAKYHYWIEQNVNRSVWTSGSSTLAPGLLTFYGSIEPLDRRWHVMGLGYDMDIDERLLESAAVVHFSGFMKPWLKLSINRYRHLWARYLNTSHPSIRSCSIY